MVPKTPAPVRRPLCLWMVHLWRYTCRRIIRLVSIHFDRRRNVWEGPLLSTCKIFWKLLKISSFFDTAFKIIKSLPSFTPSKRPGQPKNDFYPTVCACACFFIEKKCTNYVCETAPILFQSNWLRYVSVLGHRESFIGDESKFWLYAGLIKKLYSDAHPYTYSL